MKNLNIFLMLLVYITIVAAIILSHVFIGRFMKNYEMNLAKKKDYWQVIFGKCKKEKSYFLRKRLIKKLKNATMLAAFSDAYHEARESDPGIKKILCDNRVQIAELGSKLHSHTMRAFFAYMLAGFGLQRPEEHQLYDDLMLSYLSDNSVYVCENALLALFSFGDGETIAKAFVNLSEKKIYHSEKLLGDGLLKFTGDKAELAKKLMDIFGKLSSCFKVAVINFLRYTGNHSYDADFRGLLEKNDTSTDVLCCIIRLLSKSYSIQNGEAILKVLKSNYNRENWEPAAVAASSLVPYAFEPVIRVLVEALHSKTWYVRVNSAKSLAAMKVSDAYIFKVISKNDRYAIEELTYELSKQGGGEAS